MTIKLDSKKDIEILDKINEYCKDLYQKALNESYVYKFEFTNNTIDDRKIKAYNEKTKKNSTLMCIFAMMSKNNIVKINDDILKLCKDILREHLTNSDFKNFIEKLETNIEVPPKYINTLVYLLGNMIPIVTFEVNCTEEEMKNDNNCIINIHMFIDIPDIDTSSGRDNILKIDSYLSNKKMKVNRLSKKSSKKNKKSSKKSKK